MTDKSYSLGPIALEWLKDALHAQGTGGLSWHTSAWFAKKRWEPTQRIIDSLLSKETINHSELLLIGGSGGWMMSSQWLTQFRTIKIIDIDPLAPIFFSLNHGKALKKSGTKWYFERRDGLRELPLLINESTKSLIWFDNVLGQQCFKLKDEDLVVRHLKHIKEILKGRHWGSIHDWLSGPVEVNNDLLNINKTSLYKTSTIAFTRRQEKVLPSQNVLILNDKEIEFDEGTQSLLNQVNAKGEWQDHLSEEVFPTAQTCQLIPWYFKPNYCHLLLASFIQPVN